MILSAWHSAHQSHLRQIAAGGRRDGERARLDVADGVEAPSPHRERVAQKKRSAIMIEARRETRRHGM